MATLRDMERYAFHFCNEFSVTLIPPDTDAEEAPAPLHFKHDELKMAGRLNQSLASDVHPIDIGDLDFALPVMRVEDHPIVRYHELAVP